MDMSADENGLGAGEERSISTACSGLVVIIISTEVLLKCVSRCVSGWCARQAVL
jgi:hypothetical protein